MTTFAISLKNEIARIARKELKDELQALRKNSSAYRSEIAELKRKIKALQSQVNALAKAKRGSTRSADTAVAETAAPKRSRAFHADQLKQHRVKLGISQAQMATLLGSSQLSVWKWETGKVTPRAAQLERIKATLKLGKRVALERLAKG